MDSTHDGGKYDQLLDHAKCHISWGIIVTRVIWAQSIQYEHVYMENHIIVNVLFENEINRVKSILYQFSAFNFLKSHRHLHCTEPLFQLLQGCQKLIVNCPKSLCALFEARFSEAKIPLISGSKPPKVFSLQILSPKCLAVTVRPLAKMRKMIRVILSYLQNGQRCLHCLEQCTGCT